MKTAEGGTVAQYNVTQSWWFQTIVTLNTLNMMYHIKLFALFMVLFAGFIMVRDQIRKTMTTKLLIGGLATIALGAVSLALPGSLTDIWR